MSDADLRGRTAIVTGASQGIGRHVALRLAGAGAGVALVARSRPALGALEAEIAAQGGRAVAVPADVGDPEQVAHAAAAAEARLGPPDVVVSVSGIAGPTKELWRLDLTEWEETFRVNVTGTFLVCRAVLPGMIERRSGSIVVIGSATGKRPLPGRTPYAASKTALIGLVRTLAWEVGAHGIRVNLVSPGPVTGERLDAVVERQAAARARTAQEVRSDLRAAAPLGRLTAPEEVAEAVAFLAGDASRAVTGEDLNVSAGWVMHG